MADFFDKLAKQFGQTDSSHIGQAVEELVNQAIMRRRAHERRWYDNNFFDDGYHFRSISRKTGRVIDHTSRSAGYVERAIPRASRQIRGISNLLFAAEPYPVVYPERITISDYPDQTDLKTGQPIPNSPYEQAVKKNKDIARKRGTWLSTEWDDEQNLPLKLIDMILIAAKNSVSWMEVYSDTDKQKIITNVYDAFDVICYGDVRDEAKLPFITKACPMTLPEIMSDSRFDAAMVKKLTPDNRYATSEIKDAYMRSRFGAKSPSEQKDGTIIVKETEMKEILTDDNWKEAIAKGENNGAMEGKSRGDGVMRHVFSAAGVTLDDEYIDYDDYSLVPFRFEPGPLYQVPFIERFIPQNKSLDVIITRLEKWVNAMVVGVYQVRKGENMQVSNFPGGQKIEYEGTPLSQMNVANVGNTPFEVINLLNKFIDEQGATTAGGQNLPTGVKSGVAIESVKATEYANLKITNLMLKRTIKNIAERMLERAHKDFLKPVEVSSIEDGQPNYFDVIGKRGYDLSKKVGKQLPDDIVTLDKDVKLRIEIEPGLGLTMDGKKQAMESIIDYMLKLAQAIPGSIPPEALQQVIKKFLEAFGYGSTQELMEAMEQGMTQGQMTEEQIMRMKVAIVEAMKDSGAVGPVAENRMVDTTKVGVLQALKDSGIADAVGQGQQVQEKPLSESLSITYKDLPEDVKREVEAKIGLTPSKGISPTGSQQVDTHAKTAIAVQNATNPQAEIALKAKTLDQQQSQHQDQLSLQAKQQQDTVASSSAERALKEKAMKQKPMKGAKNGS